MHPFLVAAFRTATLLLVFVGSTPWVSATTLRRLSLDEMVEAATDVVTARVVDSEVRTDPQSRHHYTVTRFEVLDVAKGSRRVRQTIEVEVLGGEAPGAGYATVVADAPSFQPGETVVLFAAPGERGAQRIIGFSQGVLRTDPSSNTSNGRVVRGAPVSSTAVPLGSPNHRPAALHRSDRPAPVPGHAGEPRSAPPVGEQRRVTVDELLDRVRRIASRLGASR